MERRRSGLKSSSTTSSSIWYQLGQGPKRKRRQSMGLHRTKAHLARRRHRLSSTDSDDVKMVEQSMGWAKFLVLFSLDIAMVMFNIIFWSMTNIFLFFFSKIHNTILAKIVGFHYLYNVSWEDPRVDREALNLTEDDHVLTIASAGDNVLSFIIDGAKVTAVDLNPCQLALCELKKAAILELTFDQFFDIFALQNIELLKQVYPRLKRHMDSYACDFWDNKLTHFGSFMYSGSSGWLAYFLFRILFKVIGFGWIRQAIIDGVSQEEFRARCKKHEKRLEFVAWVSDSILAPIFAPLAGVPEAQLKLGNDREGNFHTIMERVLLNTDLVADNYFFLGYILGRYTERCCPRYLKREHFPTLKQAMKDKKLILYHGTLADRLREDANNEVSVKYTAAIMLDHLDWMDDAGVNEELALLWPLLDNENGRILWRSFSSEPHRAALKHLEPLKVDDGRSDRTGMYWGVWVAHKRKALIHPEVNTPGLFWQQPRPHSTLQQLMTGAKIVSFPVINKAMSIIGSVSNDSSHLRNNPHAQKIEAFYRSQADAYDAFRENFLHARSRLAASLPLPTGKLIWIDVGAGTARNLEFFSIETLKRRFDKIYILDISASLLEVARQRVEKAGLSDIVELIHADFTDLSDEGRIKLPDAGSANLITFSYSLSMIPDKSAALRQAGRLLAPGGILGIADFFHHGSATKYKNQPLKRTFSKVYDWGCKMWFKQDGVHLLDTKVFFNVEPDEADCILFERFRGGVPLLPFLRPWHGYWIARKPSFAEAVEGDDDSAFVSEHHPDSPIEEEDEEMSNDEDGINQDDDDVEDLDQDDDGINQDHDDVEDLDQDDDDASKQDEVGATDDE